MYTPRLSTPEPFDVPRWTEADADNDLAVSNLSRILQAAKAPMQQTQVQQQTLGGALSLPSLGLTKSRDWQQVYQKPPAPADTFTPGTATNTGGTPVKAGKGVTAYGFKGVTGQAQHRGSAPYGFQPEMWDALSRANAAMKAAGLGTFSITDGFRSYQQQVATKKKKPGLAATPGRSIHGLGLAADLKLTKAQAEWLYRNGAKFGLYHQAGFKREPWHVALLPQLYKRGWG